MLVINSQLDAKMPTWYSCNPFGGLARLGAGLVAPAVTVFLSFLFNLQIYLITGYPAATTRDSSDRDTYLNINKVRNPIL